MQKIVVLALALYATVISGKAVPDAPQRIVGGTLTTIDHYPGIASMLFDYQELIAVHVQVCGGNILTTRIILSAAHCYENDMVVHNVAWWKTRVGSTYANSGGAVHDIDMIVIEPTSYHTWTLDGDLAILRTATTMVYIPNAVAPVSIAGTSYELAANQEVWAAGWGATGVLEGASEQLRHVQVYTISHEDCLSRYGGGVTLNMLCSGILDEGGRDQCQGDSGGPLYHNNVLVGVCSWGIGCASHLYPGVNAKVSMFTNWIVDTAAEMANM